MPRRDGTGPVGMGRMTGRGMGIWPAGGCRRSFGGCYDNQFAEVNDKDLLMQEKDLLEKRMAAIDKQLENQA